MRAEVRDDIISLDSFVQARFKFEKYLIFLKNAGNYCFLDQFKRLFEKGEIIAKNMEELNLIKTETLNNNYKYVYLTDTAMKYLILKDDIKEYNEVAKNTISVMKVNKYPSEKVLMSSALKFELTAKNKNKILIKENLIINVRKSFYNKNTTTYNNLKIDELKKEMEIIKLEYSKEIAMQNKTIQLLQEVLSISPMKIGDDLNELEVNINKDLKKQEQESQNLRLLDTRRRKESQENISQLKHELEKVRFFIELEKKIHGQIEKAKVPTQSLAIKYNNAKKQIENMEKEKEKKIEIDNQFSVLESKILNMYDKSKIVCYFIDEELQFLILDTGNTKTAFAYLKIISDLKKLCKFNKINIFIVSYSENRAKNLLNEFQDTQNRKVKAEEIMSEYETKAGVTRDYRKSWKYAPTFYINAENIYNNTPSLNTVTYAKNTVILEAYKKNLSMSDNYIRNKDKKSIEDLKEKFRKSN